MATTGIDPHDLGQDELVGEIEGVLARWDRRFAGRPDVERRRLLLLALEREQVVTVAYREEVMVARLAQLDLPLEFRRVLRHALVWAWKDEELHADYVRGLLLRTGRPLPALVIFGRQLAGAAGGWASAVRHHRVAGRAPVRSLAASALIGAARLSGRLSPALARQLRFQSFRHYCLLNATLERTAELGYGRAAELAASPEEREAVDRIRADEARHGRVFRLLAAALDDHDRAASGVTAASLADDLTRISPWFVPAELRPPATAQARARDRAFGSGAPPVRVERASAGDDLGTVLRRSLDAAGIGALVADRGGPVAVRASFMLGYHRDDRSNVGDPRVVDELARYVREHGATDVAVLEAPSVYGRFFARRSVAEVAAYLGFDSPAYRLVDLADDQVPWSYDRGLAQPTISRTWRDAAVRIVVPKLRTDPTEIAHLSLSALHGMDGRVAETIHPDRQVSYRNAVMMLLDHAPPDAAVVDAWGPVADGPFGVMGCARPAVVHRFYAGRDALAVDAAVLADLGVDDPRAAPSIRTACHWFGLDPGRPTVADGAPLPLRLRLPAATSWSRLVARLGPPVYTYASRRGERFVPAMDVDAFPPLARPSLATRAVRHAVQRAFGLHPPD